MSNARRMFCLLLFCAIVMIFSIKFFYSDLTEQEKNISIAQVEKNDCQDKIIGYVVGQYQNIYKPRKALSCANIR